MATEVFCFCGRPYESTQFMIQCDGCKEWFHGSCVNVKEYLSADIEKYFCSKCEPFHGPTSYKPKYNWHRHDYSDPDALHKATQVGTSVFIKQLKERSFPGGDEVIIRLRGQQLTLPYLINNGFSRPIMIEGRDGLDLNLPQEGFTVQDVENYVGSDRIIDVIDVTKQSDVRMTLKEFVEYFTEPLRTKVFNVISLEFSDTDLSALVDPPYIARKLCWVNNLWPHDSPIVRPEVQKYCLMGVKDSYTDFHIDFGGSSVWYHVFKGEKIFYLVPPTKTNLDLYQQWLLKPNHHEIFFGDMVDACYKVILPQGFTMLIPTGWIHAVFTPKDSLVFGGNFLHNLNIELQLQVYNIELTTKAPTKFRFPLFEAMHWFASERLVEDLRDLNKQSSRCPEHLIRGVRALLNALNTWAADQNNGKGKSDPIPERIIVHKLLKDLSRELRHAERNSNLTITSSPISTAKAAIKASKLEKDQPTKRVRRKPQARADFVDINEALSNFAAEEGRLLKKEKVKKSSSPQADQPRTLPLKLMLPKRITLDDEEEGNLMIDEKSSKKKPAKIGQSQQRGPIKIRLSVGSRTDYQLAETTEVAAHMDIETGDDDLNNSTNSGGIENLLRASDMGGTPSLEELNNTGRASPSTQEAIVGMLTMSRGFSSPDEGGLSNSGAPPIPTISQRHRKGRRRINSAFADDYSDVVSKVHQDDEYIYPSLDASDDEGPYDKKKSAKNGKGRPDDESWNPRARVGNLLPKTNRPTRDGAKRPAVERVLEAAAQRRALEPPPKRAYIRRMKSRPEVPQPEAGSSTAIKTVPSTPSTPTTASVQPSPLSKVENTKANLVKKPKKGMATAKQRLGKILKIHKMVH